MKFKNFRMWRQKLPHWRADQVYYYLTFRHRRELNEDELRILFKSLLYIDGTKVNYHVISCLPGESELIFEQDHEVNPDFSEVIESLKKKASKKIQKVTSEKYPVFYTESFDRIIRDQAEYDEKVQEICLKVENYLIENGYDEDYDFLWMSDKETVFSEA